MVVADDEVPYFCWDRSLTGGELRSILRDPHHPEYLATLGLLLREAKPFLALAHRWMEVS